MIYKRDSDFSSLTFGEYRLALLTRAARVRGPFTVETREGLLTCPDGYLVIDTHGWPFPIRVDEFRRLYEAT